MKQLGMIVLAAAVALIALVGCGDNEEAQVVPGVQTTRLESAQEVPPNTSTATGEFKVLISDDERFLTWHIDYQGLVADATGAHIHLGQRGVVGGIVVHFCGTGGKPPCPTPSGSLDGVATSADVVALAAPNPITIAAGDFATLVRQLRSGNVYANVHSTRLPGGEIRGQVPPR
ncbi:MAG: CHRD domain-containing protein [Nitrospinae bacterium]|nr:CHRD domain-containing protein [Nitrospinota bacterium]